MRQGTIERLEALENASDATVGRVVVYRSGDEMKRPPGALGVVVFIPDNGRDPPSNRTKE